MRKIIKVLLFVSTLISCNENHTIVKYVCYDITITRIDKATETSFYYSSQTKKDAGRIWVNYSGIDSYFEVLLMFDKKKHQVTVLSCDAYLKSEGLDTTYFKTGRYDYEDKKVNPFGVVNRNYENVEFYTVIPSTRYEKERNLKTKTKVKAIYEKASDLVLPK